MTSMSRVLITGATGNIGRALVAQLVQDAPDLDVIAAAPKGESVAQAQGRVLNLLDPASAIAAMHGVDRLFLVTPAHPEMEAMTARAVKAAQSAGVRHIKPARCARHLRELVPVPLVEAVGSTPCLPCCRLPPRIRFAC